MSAEPRTVVHYSDAASFGGAEQALLHLLAHLDRARWRSVLLHHPDAPARLVDGARALGVPARPAPHVARAADVARLPGLARLVRALAPAVFHAHQTWPLSCKLAIAAAAAVRVPAVVATVQLFVDPRGAARLGALQYRALVAATDAVIAVSGDVAARLGALGVPRGRVRVVANAVDAGDGAPLDAARRAALRAEMAGAEAAARGAPVVLAVARLEPQKALDVLVDAAARLPGAAIAVAGSGPDRAALEARAAACGAGGRVRFLGHRADVPALLRAADVFVLPSLHEGLPLAVLEAMAARLPVVATDVDGTREAVADGETGLLVPARDPAALAGAVARLLADAALARRLSDAAFERVRRDFGVAAMARAVAAVYDECSAHRAAAGAAGRAA